MQIFTEFMYDHDFMTDVSVSVNTPIPNTYIKVGVSNLISPNKNIDSSYIHVGIGASTPSILPITISYSFGMGNTTSTKHDYNKKSVNTGVGAFLGFDRGWSDSANVFSFTVSNSYGLYGGYDYYWCID